MSEPTPQPEQPTPSQPQQGPTPKPAAKSQETKTIPQSQLQYIVDSSLVSFLDQQVCIHTFDSSMFVGELCAFDQANSVTVKDARQRWVCDDKFAERVVGSVYLPGSNISMIASRDDTYLNKLVEITPDEIFAALKEKKINTAIE